MQTKSSLAVYALCVAFLSACGGGGGGEPTAKEEILTMTGKVVGQGAAGAQVSVSVGSQTFVTTADSSGNYQVTLVVNETAANALVSILAKFPGTKSFVEQLSRVGNFSALQARAGSDATLTASEEIRANVSSLSTAEAVLIESAAGGSGKAFGFGAGVDPEQALSLAAALDLATADPARFALPQGSATTLALARNGNAREAFVEAIPATDLQQAKETLIRDVNVVGATPASAVPVELLAATLDLAGQFPLNFSASVDGFEFAAGGSGRYFSSGPRSATRWSVDGTRIVVQLDAPLGFTSFESVDCDGTGTQSQRETQRTTSTIELVLLSPTAASVTRNSSVVTPGCPAVPPRNENVTTAKVLLNSATLQSFTPADISGRSYSIPVLSASPGPIGERVQADILDFQAGGTGNGRFLVGSFNWALDSGVLTLTYGGNVNGRYQPVRSVDGIARAVFADFTGPDGRYADVLLALPRDPQFAINFSEVPVDYFQFGLGVENVRNVDSRLLGFRLSLNADGTGAQVDDFVGADGTVQTTQVPFRWSPLGSELAIRRYANSQTGARGCDPQTPNCVLFDERIITPVNRNGERFYWLERRRINASGALTGNEPQSFLSRFYDRVPRS